MKDLSHQIELNRQGQHEVVFSTRRVELTPPADYYERLSWIQDSFRQFLYSVEDFEILRSRSDIKQ